MPNADKRLELLRLIIAQPEHVAGLALVTPNEFFDGNDDLGSIGCNLARHPGLACFRHVLDRLLALPTVDQVWLQIYDIDEGDWPFSENVLVFGNITTGQVEPFASEIFPSEIDEMQIDWTPSRDARLEGRRYVNLWWD